MTSTVVKLKAEETADDPIKEYLALDLGDASALRKGLMDRMEIEAEQDLIPLTDLADGSPPFLTQTMDAWFRDEIAFTRRRALEQVKNRLASDKPHEGAPGCLIEAEREEVEDAYIRDCREARKQVRQKRRADQLKIDDLQLKIGQGKREFAALRAELGREPRVPNPLLYWGLMLVVCIAEGLINFESFASLSWATPFIATGLSFVIGLAIALAAHMHGTLIKQWRAYFDDDVDPKERWVAGRMFGIGTTCLTFSLAAVAYARNVYFAQNALSAAAFGDGGGGQKFWIVGGSLLGNMIVYLVGVVLAYLMHDAVAKYAELKKTLEKETAQRDALMTSIDAEIAARLKGADTHRRRALEALDNRDDAQRTAPEYTANRKLFDSIVAQDNRVVGALQGYRIGLCKKKKADGEAFVRNDEYDADVKVRLDSAGYLQLPLKLKYA